jgi:LPPG:FO 2-phospho-L-lactate transferase
MSARGNKVIALAGGVGGAKLADGLAQHLGEALTVVVNTGDDFEHLGFHISPDLDTVMYTLAGVANKAQGWGVENESWAFLDQLGRLGGPTWFRLGDRDLATHVFRTQRLRAGATLTQVTDELCGSLGVRPRILPMCDEPVSTVVISKGEKIAFQEYFVKLACGVPVESIFFDGAERAQWNKALGSLPAGGEIAALIICPSNPYISVDPILAVPGARAWLKYCRAPVLAVSPIVAGDAIKGPAAKIMRELNIAVSATSVAKHYAGLVDGLVIDTSDGVLSDEIRALGLAVHVTQTVMRSPADRAALAGECLAFARRILVDRPEIARR